MTDFSDVTSSGPLDPRQERVHDDNYVLNELKRAFLHTTDNFDRQSTHQITDLLDVPGEHNFSPERLRYYKDGARRFLEYGSDANYSETAVGHLLDPDSGQTLTLNSAEQVAYPVGLDLVVGMARRIPQAPQSGDVIGGGYGNIDLANFDPETHTYSGTDADGYFWYHTAETGLDEVVLAMVQAGTIQYERTVSLPVAADILSILEGQLNWYAVGPAIWRQSYTDIAAQPDDPQQNDVIGAVANDDGKGPESGSQRVVMAIHQAAGNSGLSLEVGSIGVRASGVPNFQFKTKGHRMEFENTNTDPDTYQVLGAIRSDPARPNVKVRIVGLEITQTPGSSVSDLEILVVAVAPEETNAPAGGSWSTPVEHNPANSVVEIVTVPGDATTPLTGPDQAGAGTDVDGPDRANTMTNPGGYQMGRDEVDVEGTGSKTAKATGQQVGNREKYDTDIALVLIRSGTAGTAQVQIQTEQNS